MPAHDSGFGRYVSAGHFLLDHDEQKDSLAMDKPKAVAASPEMGASEAARALG